MAAAELGLAVAQPQTLRDAELPARLGARPDLLVVIAYGLLLPRALLAWPLRGCVNLHASLLPRWRGAAPIQHAILAGDTTTGISVMQMDAGLDTGPVYLERPTPIGARETAGELHDRLAVLAAQSLMSVLPDLLAGQATAVAQVEGLATVAPKIAKTDGVLDWRLGAVELERRVRAFNPWPVATAQLSDGRRLRVWDATAIDSAAGAPGNIVATESGAIDVATSAGALRLLRVQPPSGRDMDAQAYLAAHSLEGVTFVT
jgi:methionyl-tRNA formyltransferase